MVTRLISFESPHHLSPINIQNRFGPLVKPKTKSYSSTTTSGPLFPPGFENLIPIPIKKAHTKKKQKQKKQETPSLNPNQMNSSAPPDHPNTHTKGQLKITPSVILKFADEIGLEFNGPRSELEYRINRILSRQNSEWSPNAV